MTITVSPNARGLSRSLSTEAFNYEPIFGDEDKENPISCGICVTKKGQPTTFKSPCTGFVIVLEGEICLEDGTKPGEQNMLKPGDVVRIGKGTTAKWSSPSEGKAFYVGQVGVEEDMEKYVV